MGETGQFGLKALSGHGALLLVMGGVDEDEFLRGLVFGLCRKS